MRTQSDNIAEIEKLQRETSIAPIPLVKSHLRKVTIVRKKINARVDKLAASTYDLLYEWQAHSNNSLYFDHYRSSQTKTTSKKCMTGSSWKSMK